MIRASSLRFLWGFVNWIAYELKVIKIYLVDICNILMTDTVNILTFSSLVLLYESIFRRINSTIKCCNNYKLNEKGTGCVGECHIFLD